MSDQETQKESDTITNTQEPAKKSSDTDKKAVGLQKFDKLFSDIFGSVMENSSKGKNTKKSDEYDENDDENIFDTEDDEEESDNESDTDEDQEDEFDEDKWNAFSKLIESHLLLSKTLTSMLKK